MHLILTGATGLVGCAALDAMIKAKDVSKISILSRKPVRMAEALKDPRVNVIIHSDFAKYDSSVLDQLRDAAGCVWALGISQNAVGDEEYIKITRTWPEAAAETFATMSESQRADDSAKSEPFRFVYVSGEGATDKPGMMTPKYGRVKGEAEVALGNMCTSLGEGDMKGKALRVYSTRLAMVDPNKHQAILPHIPKQKGYESVVRQIGGVVYKSFHSPTEVTGAYLTRLAAGQLDGKIEGAGAFRTGSSWVISNVGMRRIMGL